MQNQLTGNEENVVRESVTLINITLADNWALKAELHWLLWIGLLAALVVSVLWSIKGFRFRSYEIDEAEFGFGNQKIKIRPNTVDAQVAYRMWVELTTRKIGLPIDENHDVISEVYDSWYGFFSVARGLIGDIPASKMKRRDTEAIVKLSVDVLNKGIRPHLTRWQARFRKWFDSENLTEANKALPPQEIQKNFPNYEVLMTDLKLVNQLLTRYKDEMYTLAVGK